MSVSVEKTYADALLSLINEDSGGDKLLLKETLDELEELGQIFRSTPGFFKFMRTPAISSSEKMSIVKKTLEGRVSTITLNFLQTLVYNRRVEYYYKIIREYRRLYSDMLGIVVIDVTTPFPIDDEDREKIIVKMSHYLGKTAVLNEKVDKRIIGGIIIDYSGKRLDGSTRMRLETLKRELGEQTDKLLN